MIDPHESANDALDPIGPLVPAAPIVSQLFSLGQQAESADTRVAEATAWLHAELVSLLDDVKHARIDVYQATREGFPADVIRTHLRDMVRRVLERDHPNTPIDAPHVEREVDRLMAEQQFDREMAWGLVPDELSLKPVLIPVRPLWALLCRWLDEIETPNAPGVEFRRLGIKLLDALLEHIASQHVTLAQAARETGLPPDELLGLIRIGSLVADGDTRSPRLLRSQFFTSRFQAVAHQLRGESP